MEALKPTQPVTSSYFHYLGKASTNKNQHLLAYHSLDVAAVAFTLLQTNKNFTEDLANLLELQPKELIKLVSFFVGLHDLGKFASAFQLLFDNHTFTFNQNKKVKPYDSKNFRHDRLGYYFWRDNEEEIAQNLTENQELNDDDLDEILEVLEILAQTVLGHHGQPISTQSFGLKAFVEHHNQQAAAEFIQALLDIFQPSLDTELLLSSSWQAKLKQISWHLAGFAVLADWLGSNRDFFPYKNQPTDLITYWKQAKQQAKIAVEATDIWRNIHVQPFISVKHHYGFNPTPLQKWAETLDIDNTPQLFILEDVTGAGKTEAALTLTHRLMEAGAASGFYFGLPTQATSNAMFQRVANHYLQMLASDGNRKPSLVLAHAAREMNNLFLSSVLPQDTLDKDYSSTDVTATAQCNAWLADSRKKALLAPVGVGTLDQTLLAVLPRRHQSLRLLGLHQKILIFDEVHSADEYMLELLENLLTLHLHQGGSAILLTATLAKKQRQKLINIWAKTLQLGEQPIQNTHFPLATKVSLNGLEEFSLASRQEVSREVQIKFLHSPDKCIEKIIEAANAGKCVVWVRNTVDDAINAYQEISNRVNDPKNCLLFHSRFTLKDRKTREEEVLTIFGKSSTDKERAGKILIATQVFQESLDVDADLMLSDICPIDDLIQRAGRLHRHSRNSLGTYQAETTDTRSQPLLYVHSPEWQDNPSANWLAEKFQTTEYVYRSPGRLWLAMQVLKKLQALRMPEEARQLIEAVYSEDALERMPQALQSKELEHLGSERSKAAKAQANIIHWQQQGYSQKSSPNWYEDTTDISTRYSDIETAEVVLVQENSLGQLEFYSSDTSYGLQLSSVKLGVKKYLTKLNLINYEDSRLEVIKKRYPYIKLKFLNIWEYRQDMNFAYSPTLGVYTKNTGKKE